MIADAWLGSFEHLIVALVTGGAAVAAAWVSTKHRNETRSDHLVVGKKLEELIEITHEIRQDVRENRQDIRDNRKMIQEIEDRL